VARKLAVEIVGSAASLKAALGSASSAVNTFAAEYKTAFAGMSTSTLQLAVAQDKLAISTARYGVGTTGAAAATVKYRKEVEALANSQAMAFGKMGHALTRGVTIPTLLLGAAATKMSIEYHKQMLMIQTDAGASATELKNMTGAVLDLARTSPEGPEELAKGLYHLESLGLRGKEALDALRVSGVAAGMTLANLEDVTTALGGAVVSGIKGTENFNDTMGTIIATIGQGNMRLQDMVGALGTGLLPAAKNAGLSLNQVGAALAVLTDRGVSAENAGTRLRMTFALMQAPSDKAKKALAEMGIDADDMAAKLSGPNGLMVVLTMLHKAMQRVGSVKGAQLILRAFGGGRSGAGILTLIQSLDSEVSSYQGKLVAIQANQKAFAENSKTYMESPAYKMQRAWNSLKVDLINLGHSLTPAMIGIANAVSIVARAFGILPNELKRAIGIIVGLLAVGGPMFLAFSGIRRMIYAIGTAFRVLPAEAAIGAAGTNASLASIDAAAATTSAEMSVLATRISMYGVGAPAAAAEVSASMTASTAATTGLQTALAGVQARMLGLARLGTVVLTVVLALSLVPGNEAGKQVLEQTGGGFLSGIPVLGDIADQTANFANKHIRPLIGKKPIKTAVDSQMTQEQIDESSKAYKDIYDMSFKQFKKKFGGDLKYYKNVQKSAENWLLQHMPGFVPRSPKLNLPKLGGFGPGMTLPTRLSRATEWAEIHKGLNDNLKAAINERDYWKKQLGKADPTTDAYDTILAYYSQSAQKVESIQGQINSQAKKRNKVKFDIPVAMSTAISAAVAGKNPEKEVAAIKRAINYVKQQIAHETNAHKKMLEEKKLAQLVGQESAAKKRMILPPAMEGAVAKAIAGNNPEKALATIKRAISFLKQKIAHEKDAAVKLVEEKKLSTLVGQANAERKKIGNKIIEGLESAVEAAKITPGITDDIAKMKELKTGLLEQIKIQKGNTDLQKKLDAVNNDFAQMRQNMIETFRGQMGTLGGGPVINPESDPIRPFILGVRRNAQDYLRDIKRQISEFQNMQNLLKTLGKRGASTGLLDELRGQGMQAFPEVFALAHADKGTLKKFFSAYKEREKILSVTANAIINAKDVTINASNLKTKMPVGHPPAIGADYARSEPRGHPPAMSTQTAARATQNVGKTANSDVRVLSARSEDVTHLHINIDGREVAEVVIPHAQKKTKANAAQRRGRHGGSSTGIH
jgi:TP901 family phage tail tape measure protein